MKAYFKQSKLKYTLLYMEDIKLKKIAIIEDDTDICNMITKFLINHNYEVYSAPNGREGIDLCQKFLPDLIILDLMLPILNGDSVIKQLRTYTDIPVIVVSAKTMVQSKIDLLRLGADDYMPKPFNPLELVARVKAQLRRYTQYNDGGKEEGDIIDFGGLLLNRTSHECVYNEVPLTLTPIEFDILWLLCENRGKVISSEELFEKVWNEKYYKNSNNTVMVHIRHLREKMSAPTGKSDFIKTVWGVGYKIEE